MGPGRARDESLPPPKLERIRRSGACKFVRIYHLAAA
jgi:hypothetical protein